MSTDMHWSTLQNSFNPELEIPQYPYGRLLHPPLLTS